MTTKQYILVGLGLVGVAIILSFFINRQEAGVRGYVRAFCKCADKFAPMQTQFEIGRLDERTYRAAREEHKICLDKRNPFAGLSAEDSVAFLRDFVHGVRLECPHTARNVGFKID
jgi:hypothetical protein